MSLLLNSRDSRVPRCHDYDAIHKKTENREYGSEFPVTQITKTRRVLFTESSMILNSVSAVAQPFPPHKYDILVRLDAAL